MSSVKATARRDPPTPAHEWVVYRNAFLTSPAQAQIAAIRQGARASNLIGVAEAMRVPR